MIPSNNVLANESIDTSVKPSINYKMNFPKENVNGYVDELEAMKQVVYKILSTQRYKYIIYSWAYGIETEDLFGKPVNYVITQLKRRITEALVQDDRILSVEDFEFDTSIRGVAGVRFNVNTIFGVVQGDKVVQIGTKV